MYTLTLDEQTYNGADLRYLYYPGDDEYVVGDFTVNLSMEECGTISFTMYKDHPWFGSIIPRVSMVTFKRDGKILFNGQVHSTSVNIDGSMKVYGVDELSFLLDSIQPQRYLTGYGYSAVMNTLLTYHNSIMPRDRWFFSGTVEGPGDGQSQNIVTTNYDKTLDVIREELSETNYNGDHYRNYVLVRRVDPYNVDIVASPRYIDSYCFYIDSTVPTHGEVNQTIRLAHNMQDYQYDLNGESITTAIIPLGARLDTEVVPGLEAKLDIKSVNDGKNYIVDDSAAAVYGLIFDVVEYDDITTAAKLKQLGIRELARRISAIKQFTVSAIDLSYVDQSFDAFELGKTVRVQEPSARNRTVPDDELPKYGIIGLNINPLDPSSDTVTLVSTLQTVQ